MSIDTARKHLENAANCGRAGMKWEANIELCLDAIIDTLEARDNRMTVATPTVTPEQVVEAVRWCSNLEHNLVQGPSRILIAAVRKLSKRVISLNSGRELAAHEVLEAMNTQAIARAVQEMQDGAPTRHTQVLGSSPYDAGPLGVVGQSKRRTG